MGRQVQGLVLAWIGRSDVFSTETAGTFSIDNCVVVVGECCGRSIMVARALASRSFIKDRSRQEWWLEPLSAHTWLGARVSSKGWDQLWIHWQLWGPWVLVCFPVPA